MRFQEDDDDKLIEDVIDFIIKRTDEDEDGEPPDEDTVVECMGLSDAHWDLVRKAYDIYWSRL